MLDYGVSLQSDCCRGGSYGVFMKILILSHEYPPIGGGGANACMFLSSKYGEMNNEVTVLTVWYEGTKEYEELQDGRVRIIRLKAKRARKESCGFPEMLDYLAKAKRFFKNGKVINANDFDICQVFFGIPSGPLGYYLKKKYGIPYVIRLGGGDIPGFQNRFKFLYKLLAIPLKIIWSNAAAIVANSEGLKLFATNFYDKCKIDVINNGVDADVFTPKHKDELSDTLRFVFVSRLIERKGLQNLIPHLNEIVEHTGKKISLTIVGDGPYRERLEELTDLADVRDMVFFVGQKDKSELSSYYDGADAFVFPSYREGMPNVVLEAMSSGLPIIMLESCEGSKELVTGNGILCKDGICEGVERFIRLSCEERQKMSKESRSRALELFSWDSIAQKYVSLFDEVIKKR